MAFTVTARQIGNSATTSAQTLISNSTTPTASSLFLTFTSCANNGHSQAKAWQTPVGGSLSYTTVATSADSGYNGDATFALQSIGYRADVGGSPSAFTVTVDAYSTTNVGWYDLICLDITGHNTSTPVQSATGGATKGGGDSETGTVILGSTPTAGNLIVAYFSSEVSSGGGGGGIASPTAGGGKTFTSVAANSAPFTQGAVFYRVADGAESTTITCSDLGQGVGCYGAVALEIAATAGGPAPTLTFLRPMMTPRTI